MVPGIKTRASAPSPPLTASDCDLERDDNIEPVNDGVRRRRQRRRQQASTLQGRIDSSPCSTTSTSSSHSKPQSVPSVVSSFTSDVKPEEVPIPSIEPVRDEERAGEDLTRASRLIKASWRGTLSGADESLEWQVLRISPSRFRELYRQLEEEDPDLLDHFENQVRWDYDSLRGILVLRLMAAPIHEVLQDQLFYHIRTQLDQIAAGGEDFLRSQILSKIRPCGHAKVLLGSAHGVLAQKSPDSQLRFSGIATPPFVVEVGYSQQAADLQQLAREYYVESDGDVKTVLTFDIAYAPPAERRSASRSGKATFCLYRGPERVNKDTAFRDANGHPVPNGSLRLFLSDLVPDQVLRDLRASVRRRVEGVSIHIPFELLCQFLEQAETDQDTFDALQRDMEQRRRDGQPSKKRKSVHWDADAGVDGSGDGGEAGLGRSSSDDGQRSRSRSASQPKRRKTASRDSEYRSSRSISATDLPGRRRTRSISRSEGGLENEGQG